MPVASEAVLKAYAAIVGLLKARQMRGARHWLRAFYANINSTNQIAEVLFDNETWSEAEAALRAIPWPTESFYSIRWFLILQRPA